MKIYFLLLLTTVIVFQGCDNADQSGNSPELIDLKQAFESKQTVPISTIAQSIEYIQLETLEECMVGNNSQIYANDKYLITFGRQIFLFNREDGKFIREIGKYGRGPGEHRGTSRIFPFNEEKNTIYASKSGGKIEYSMDGQQVNSLTFPPMVFYSGSINDNYEAGFVPNLPGNDTTKVVIFSPDGAKVKVFNSNLFMVNPDAMMVWDIQGWYYRWNQKLYFSELFSSTLYEITFDSIIPRFEFNMGEYLPPFQKQYSFVPDETKKYFLLKSIFESTRYLFYSFRYNEETYTAIYDKDKKNVKLNHSSDDNDENNGFTNDIYRFISFDISSTNSNDELIGYIEAFKIEQWFQKYPKEAANLPSKFKKLSNVKESDNPVVVVLKLKR